jgi:hypothetical protein
MSVCHRPFVARAGLVCKDSLVRAVLVLVLVLKVLMEPLQCLGDDLHNRGRGEVCRLERKKERVWRGSAALA